MLLLADDAARLGLHQVLLLEPTGRVLGCAVENLRRAANSHHTSMLYVVLAGNVHLYLYARFYCIVAFVQEQAFPLFSLT